jgi:predicted amidohydrolase
MTSLAQRGTHPRARRSRRALVHLVWHPAVMRVALCQTNSGDDVAANEAQVAGLLEDAAEAGVDLAALPEVWPCQGSAKVVRSAAEPLDGPRVARLGEMAKRHRMWIHGGSVLELDGDEVFNTSVLFDRDGELVATYRKTPVRRGPSGRPAEPRVVPLLGRR